MLCVGFACGYLWFTYADRTSAALWRHSCPKDRVHALVEGLRQGLAGWRWRSISSPSRSASRDRSKLEFEKVARSPRSSLLHLTFTIYALPSIPRNLRRALSHYRIVLAGQKHAARPAIPGSTQIQRGSSCFKPNSQRDFRRGWR